MPVQNITLGEGIIRIGDEAIPIMVDGITVEQDVEDVRRVTVQARDIGYNFIQEQRKIKEMLFDIIRLLKENDGHIPLTELMKMEEKIGGSLS